MADICPPEQWDKHGVNMGLNKLKYAVAAEIDARQKELHELNSRIHDNPEPGLKEFKASAWLSEYLETNGFKVRRGIASLPTAFTASYGEGHPVIAFFAEYDALPEIGHACGHSIIAAAAAGAGIASKLAVDRYGGTVMVIGSPDEEKDGGKTVLIEGGAMSGVDAAMMIHPDVHDNAIIQALACQNLDIEFFGKEAHAAAAPEQGINALEAMILSFNAIDSLRQHMRSTARIHGIILDGGKAANIVPEHSAGEFIVRAADMKYLAELKQKVLNCFAGAATATGTRLEYRWAKSCYAGMKNNLTLAHLFQQNMVSLGRNMVISEGGTSFSTDMGNVSQVVPGIHAMVKIAPLEIKHHTPEFARAAVSEAGMRGLIDGAKALAMTAADLLSKPELVLSAKKEFAESHD